MNFLKKFYCRSFQLSFKLIQKLMPYREPKILKNEQEIAEAIIQEKCRKILIITSKSIVNNGLIADLEKALKIQKIDYCIFSNVLPNPTIKNVNECVDFCQRNACDFLIAFGGGSVIDLAKATGACISNPKMNLIQMKGLLKLSNPIPPLIAIPTTAGTGSEVTLSAVIVNDETREKYTINDFKLIPKYAMLNPKLILTLPKNLTASTGMDALTHAVEAYIGGATTKKTRKQSLEAIKLIFEYLPISFANLNNLEAREKMLYASFLAGLAFSRSLVGYVHSVSHALSGEYNLPHGETNAIILPIMLKQYSSKAHKKLWEIGAYCNLFSVETSREEGAKKVIEFIENLNTQMNISKTIPLIKNEDIPRLARLAEKEANPLYPVPKLFSAKELESIYLVIKNG